MATGKRQRKHHLVTLKRRRNNVSIIEAGGGLPQHMTPIRHWENLYLLSGEDGLPSEFDRMCFEYLVRFCGMTHVGYRPAFVGRARVQHGEKEASYTMLQNAWSIRPELLGRMLDRWLEDGVIVIVEYPSAHQGTVYYFPHMVLGPSVSYPSGLTPRPALPRPKKDRANGLKYEVVTQEIVFVVVEGQKIQLPYHFRIANPVVVDRGPEFSDGEVVEPTADQSHGTQNGDSAEWLHADPPSESERDRRSEDRNKNRAHFVSPEMGDGLLSLMTQTLSTWHHPEELDEELPQVLMAQIAQMPEPRRRPAIESLGNVLRVGMERNLPLADVIERWAEIETETEQVPTATEEDR